MENKLVPSYKNMSKPTNAYKKQFAIVLQIYRRDKDAIDLFGIERGFLLLLAASLLIQPVTFVRWISGYGGYLTRKLAIEVYALAKPFLLLGILLGGYWYYSISLFIAGLCLMDLYVYLLGLIFLSDFYSGPASFKRSLILLFVNLFESVCEFAVLYLGTQSIGTNLVATTSWSQAIYFSTVTAATVGYGDVSAISGIGRLLVVFQIFTSVVFASVILSSYVGQLFSGGWKKDRNEKKSTRRGEQRI
ncbi:potassium channel family protein [uncultured Anaeromusa sp.]|uniref:potassium channel family protein n=1 Tax=uncultured Anaeromusa sp. TaxID=673273 RepID=UPI0029C67406|nr:potassium channel family protein [uncultured Anaeromusa sp.]